MEFYVLTPEENQLLQTLKIRIRRLQSGGTLDSVKAVGGDITRQIGASFLSLKQLAGNYEKNDKIATLLWLTGQREEQIVATFLFSNQLNTEKIIQLLSRAKNIEILEYLGSQYMAHHPELFNVIESLQASEQQEHQVLVLCALAKYCQLYKPENEHIKCIFEALVHKKYADSSVQRIADRFKILC